MRYGTILYALMTRCLDKGAMDALWKVDDDYYRCIRQIHKFHCRLLAMYGKVDYDAEYDADYNSQLAEASWQSYLESREVR